ncbi:hypothetical protein [Paenibacillus tyrfis]|uniref:hypothetical protein n=1 Tax=Paenibacillus tyrfis TaxID=1501230 RepID=UPI0020A10C3B|nr:hypothetical protein [Paenibacillus tyrfis]MCP1306411.1 hypothetical protein [Paenibacillus tyrfis]
MKKSSRGPVDDIHERIEHGEYDELFDEPDQDGESQESGGSETSNPVSQEKG